MYCTVSYLPHRDFEHGFPRSSSLQHKVFHLTPLETPHTEHKHHFQNVKENATTTIITIIIIIIVGIGFSIKVFLLTDLEPTCLHCTWTMPSLNGDNSDNNWEALFPDFRDKNT